MRLALGILTAAALLLALGDGAGAEVRNGVVSARSGIPNMIGAAIAVLACFAAAAPVVAAPDAPPGGTGRRLLAWILDMLVCSTALAALALLPLAVEALATGRFEWRFDLSEPTFAPSTGSSGCSSSCFSSQARLCIGRFP